MKRISYNFAQLFENRKICRAHLCYYILARVDENKNAQKAKNLKSNFICVTFKTLEKALTKTKTNISNSKETTVKIGVGDEGHQQNIISLQSALEALKRIFLGLVVDGMKGAETVLKLNSSAKVCCQIVTFFSAFCQIQNGIWFQKRIAKYRQRSLLFAFGRLLLSNFLHYHEELSALIENKSFVEGLKRYQFCLHSTYYLDLVKVTDSLCFTA